LDDESDAEFILEDPADYASNQPRPNVGGSVDQGGETSYNMEGVHQAKTDKEAVENNSPLDNSTGDIIPDIILHGPSTSSSPINQTKGDTAEFSNV